jgi:alkylation response protein AidB-like acyl-CoA dehydrogenase
VLLALLGAAPGTPCEQLHAAYVARLRVVHPDRHVGAPAAVQEEAGRMAAELTAAWAAAQRPGVTTLTRQILRRARWEGAARPAGARIDVSL